MVHGTILYISDQATSGNSLVVALEAIGYAVVSTPSSTQAIALLFVMHSAVAVVLDQRTGQENSFDLIRNLRSICPDVLILLLCRDQVDCLPSEVDACVITGQLPEHAAAAVRWLLTEKRITVDAVHCGQRSVNADHVTGD